MARELPQLGVERAWLLGDLDPESVRPESELTLVLAHNTTEPFHRRADFFTTHLRPTVGTRFIVYTEAEAEATMLEAGDYVLMGAMRGEVAIGDE
jgi:hypothetical protein